MFEQNKEQLMIVVERIVRPILAPFSKKMTMRQELLAHLEEIYAEELAKSLDPATALQAAQTRLGDAHELRRNLQQTIPAWIQAAHRLDRLVSKYPGESNARFAIRSGTVLGMTVTVVLLFAVVLVGLLQGRNLVQLIPEFFIVMGIVFGSVFAAVSWLGLWVVQPEIDAGPQAAKLPWRIFVASLGAGLVFSAAATALTAWSNRDPALLSRLALGGFVAGAMMFPLVSELFIIERRQSVAWDRLKLGEDLLHA